MTVKRVVLLLILAVVTGAMAFAQLANGVGIGVNAQFTWLPAEWKLVYDPDNIRTEAEKEGDIKTGVGKEWDPAAYGRIKLGMGGGHTNIGFGAAIEANGSDMAALKLSDASLWFRIPAVPWVRFILGRGGDGYLGGRVGGNEFTGPVMDVGNPMGFDGSEAIFFPVDVYWSTMAVITPPIQNLYIALSLRDVGFPGLSFHGSNEQTTGGYSAKDIFSKSQIAIGYNFPNIGLLRIQYLGNVKVELDKFDAGNHLIKMINGERVPASEAGYWGYGHFSRLEAAFALFKIRDTVLDVGIKYALPLMGSYTNVGGFDVVYNPGFVVGMGLRGNIRDFSYTFLGSSNFGNGYEVTGARSHDYTNKVNFNFHFIPEYRFYFGAVGMNMGIQTSTKEILDGVEISTDERTNFGVGLWSRVNLGQSNSYLKGGITYTYLGVPGDGERQVGDVTGYLRIPLWAEINF